jgi:hypothetical protein
MHVRRFPIDKYVVERFFAEQTSRVAVLKTRAANEPVRSSTTRSRKRSASTSSEEKEEGQVVTDGHDESTAATSNGVQTPEEPSAVKSAPRRSIHYFETFCVDFWRDSRLIRNNPEDFDDMRTPRFNRELSTPLPIAAPRGFGWISAFTDRYCVVRAPEDDGVYISEPAKLCWNCSAKDHEAYKCPQVRGPSVCARFPASLCVRSDAIQRRLHAIAKRTKPMSRHRRRLAVMRARVGE